MIYYKVLDEQGAPFHGGRGQWPLPRGERPGAWLEVQGQIIPCRNGLHLCRKRDLLTWLGPTIYEAEAGSELIDHSNKVVVSRARLLRRLDTWNETTQRLFAADCAKDAVRRCRKAGIEVDSRVDDCIRTVYRFARGEATSDELSAGRSAAWSAGRSAGRSAERSAGSSAAWSAGRRSAAWSAGSAAWSAGSAAWAAGSAGRSAAWSAAWSAGRSAAWAWQTKRLFEYLEGKRQ